MLAIKLRPTGKKHQRYFRVIVAEKKSKLQGKYVDNLGWLNPHENTYNVDKDKVAQWIKKGAQPTNTVHNLLVKAGIIKGSKIPAHKKKKEKKATEQPPETTEVSTKEEIGNNKEKKKPADEKPTEPTKEKPPEEPQSDSKEK